jgi:hypothetical protein
MAMNLRSSLILAVVAMLAAGGCRSSSLRHKPKEQMPQFSASAVQAGCFVRLYRADGSYYMTRQSQKIDTQTSMLQASGIEPDGKYSWQMSPGRFDVMEGKTVSPKWLPAEFSPRNYCRAILGCFQAASMTAQGQGAPVRILGNWCYPVGFEGDLTWYQSKNGGSVDIVAIKISDTVQLMARAYEYHKATQAGILVPAKIEIYAADGKAMNEQRFIEIDYFN